MVIDAVLPRVRSWDESADGELGVRAVEWAREVGLGLDPEQEFVLERSLMTRSDGRLAHFEVAVNAPRQNGKGEIIMARQMFGLFEMGEGYQVHSAHEFKTSEKHFRRMEAAIRRCPLLLSRVKRAGTGRVIGFRYSHGDEAIELQDGSLIEFRTRTKSGMRGFDKVALLVLDEAMILPDAAHGTMMPTLRASDAPFGVQLLYAGSAADQMIHDNAVVWTRLRERGIAGDAELAYFEWSLDFDHPDSVPDEVLRDEDAWRSVNWAIGAGRVSVEHMRRELRAMGRREFCVELLGVGDPPSTDLDGEHVIPVDDWDALTDVRSLMLDPVCLSYDVAPDRSFASISAAGHRKDGLVHVELIDRKPGTGWVAERVAELVLRHQPASVSCDGRSPAASLVHLLENAGVDVDVVDVPGHVQACGHIFDLVAEKKLRHLGQGEVRAAIAGAARRPLGDAWAWSRRNSRVDITPLVSATLALFKLSSVPARVSVYGSREMLVF